MHYFVNLSGCFKRGLVGLALISAHFAVADDKPDPSVSPSPSPSPSISPCPSPLMTPVASSTPTPSPSPTTVPCVSPSPSPGESGEEVSAIPCHAIHGGLFISGPREGGLGEDGETQAPWRLKFEGGRVKWSHGDVIEKGRYECRSTVLYITIADEKQEVPFSDSSVIYQKVKYTKMEKKKDKK